jgi:hypothetical protein
MQPSGALAARALPLIWVGAAYSPYADLSGA